MKWRLEEKFYNICFDSVSLNCSIEAMLNILIPYNIRGIWLKDGRYVITFFNRIKF